MGMLESWVHYPFMNFSVNLVLKNWNIEKYFK